MTLQNDTIDGNSVPGSQQSPAYGAGIYMSAASSPTVVSSTLSNNMGDSGQHTINVRACSTPVTLTVVAHCWNMVGNPCDKQVTLPSDVRALL